jgi:hypothetical protein
MIATKVFTILNKPSALINETADIALKELLKRRLTKKEFKVLFTSETPLEDEALLAKLHIDKERASEIIETAESKIRHPKVRNEIDTLLSV